MAVGVAGFERCRQQCRHHATFFLEVLELVLCIIIIIIIQYLL